MVKKKKIFALQHATSINEKERVEMRSLKKATVAWLHLALIPDAHTSTTGKKKKKKATFEVRLINQGTAQYGSNVVVFLHLCL